jgi:hypothetical protein
MNTLWVYEDNGWSKAEENPFEDEILLGGALDHAGYVQVPGMRFGVLREGALTVNVYEARHDAKPQPPYPFVAEIATMAYGYLVLLPTLPDLVGFLRETLPIVDTSLMSAPEDILEVRED